MHRTQNSNRPNGREPRLSTREIATWLGYSERTITDWAAAWIESGESEGIPCQRIGMRKWGFLESEVQAWMDAGGLSRQVSNPRRKTG